MRRLTGGKAANRSRRPRSRFFRIKRHDGHVGDFVSGESFADVFRPQRAQMHDGAAAGEGHDEAAHEVDRMIGGNDAQVARAGPEGKDRRDGCALFEIVSVREHASLGAAAGARGIDDAGRIGALSRAKFRLALAAKLLPSPRAGKIGAGWRFGDEHGFRAIARHGSVRLANRPPQRVFDDQHARLRVRQQGQMFGGGELVVERHEHAAGVKNRIGRNQPLGLIGHEDGGAVSGGKAGFLERGGQRQGRLCEFAVGQPATLALAVGFDQAKLGGPALRGGRERGAERFVLLEVKHGSPPRANGHANRCHAAQQSGDDTARSFLV